MAGSDRLIGSFTLTCMPIAPSIIVASPADSGASELWHEQTDEHGAGQADLRCADGVHRLL